MDDRMYRTLGGTGLLGIEATLETQGGWTGNALETAVDILLAK